MTIAAAAQPLVSSALIATIALFSLATVRHALSEIGRDLRAARAGIRR